LAKPETNIKRKATRHGCPPSLLVDEDKSIEIGTVGKKVFCTGPTRAAKAGQKSLVPARRAKEGPLSFVLSESPFASESTVSRGHPSLKSLWVKHKGYGLK
jgi:hypothetical protein